MPIGACIGICISSKIPLGLMLCGTGAYASKFQFTVATFTFESIYVSLFNDDFLCLLSFENTSYIAPWRQLKSVDIDSMSLTLFDPVAKWSPI